MARYCLRRVAFRALSSPSISISARPRSITTLSPSIFRIASLGSKVSPLQKRWASEEVTQAEPEADGAAEAQHGENSIANASEAEAPTSADHHDQSTVAEAVKSAAHTASDRASAATESIGSAARTATSFMTGGERSSRPEPVASNSVYVGNLFFDVTAEDLRQEFAKAGGVENVKIIYDQRGLSKG